jgi:lipopolysaccharide/colanic/teichoic acid biosynthesis glycosyltransferase
MVTPSGLDFFSALGKKPHYVKNLSLFLDLFIIMKTFQIVVFSKGAR